MGDRGPAHKVGTRFCCADDLHSGGILQVIHTRDCLVTWSVTLYGIELGSHAYNSFLGELPTSLGDIVDNEHRFSSSDGWSVKYDHPDFRGHATSVRPRS